MLKDKADVGRELTWRMIPRIEAADQDPAAELAAGAVWNQAIEAAKQGRLSAAGSPPEGGAAPRGPGPPGEWAGGRPAGPGRARGGPGPGGPAAPAGAWGGGGAAVGGGRRAGRRVARGADGPGGGFKGGQIFWVEG